MLISGIVGYSKPRVCAQSASHVPLVALNKELCPLLKPNTGHESHGLGDVLSNFMDPLEAESGCSNARP